MKTILLSSLNKVFKDKEPNATEFTSFSSLKNENFSFQLAVLPEDEKATKSCLPTKPFAKVFIKPTLSFLFKCRHLPCKKGLGVFEV